MEIVFPVARTGLVNVFLFCTIHRILLAKSVVPGWRGLFRLLGFTGSNPSQDTEISFACRGTYGKSSESGCLKEGEEPIPRPQLGLLRANPHGLQVRIRIDHCVRSGGNREGMSNADRDTVPDLREVIPERPLPTLARERETMTSGISELTMVGEDRLKKAW